MSIAEPPENIKQVPPECAVRERIRQAAAVLADAGAAPLDRDRLQEHGERLLQELGLPREWLGFAMVAIDNAIWRPDYAAVPRRRRLLLLPKCLSAAGACPATIDADGLHCEGCGQCDLAPLQAEAEALGYGVIIAEGTGAVVSQVLEGQADAILGVACLDSLEKSFERISDMGIAHQAVPLLRDGCVDTEAELDLIRELMRLEAPADGGFGRPLQRSYLPLLRMTRTIFEVELDALLDGCMCALATPEGSRDPVEATDAIARQWLVLGGKRLRPFITLAAYVIARHGSGGLAAEADLEVMLPPAVRSTAVAIEALHKASLVHDDIEDADQFRYGQPTIHRQHGLEAAINVGDYLVGLGYRLVATQAEALGPKAVSDILAKLSSAHLRLCCGQGAELMWNSRPHDTLEPLHALQIASLKTAPAFEAALYAGLRAAGPVTEEAAITAFSGYVGEAYQVLNDLEDWEDGNGGKLSCGRDFAAGRPTILRSFATQAGASAQLAEWRRQCATDALAVIGRVRDLYAELGVFEKGETLYGRLRDRALQVADTVSDTDLADLLRVLARSVLPLRFPDHPTP